MWCEDSVRKSPNQTKEDGYTDDWQLACGKVELPVTYFHSLTIGILDFAVFFTLLGVKTTLPGEKSWNQQKVLHVTTWLWRLLDTWFWRHENIVESRTPILWVLNVPWRGGCPLQMFSWCASLSHFSCSDPDGDASSMETLLWYVRTPCWLARREERPLPVSLKEWNYSPIHTASGKMVAR